MGKYEEIWNGISDKVFTGTPEQMQAEYILMPKFFVEKKLKQWCYDREYDYEEINISDNLSYCPDYVKHMFSRAKSEDIDAVKLANAFLNSFETDLRLMAANCSYGLEKLIHDENWAVRRVIARQGYGVDMLVNDACTKVRMALAECGFGFDTLITDEEPVVRIAVVKNIIREYRRLSDETEILDIVCSSKEKVNALKKNLKRLEEYLDILVNDEASEVRIILAENGYGLDILATDEDASVRIAAAESLRREYVKLPQRVAELKRLSGIDNIDERFKGKLDKMDAYLDILAKDKTPEVRRATGFDWLVNDDDPDVRMAVARSGYALDKLINDENEFVRIIAGYAKNRYEKSNYEYPYKISSDFTFEKFKVNNDNRKMYEYMRDFAAKADNSKSVFIGGWGICRTQLMLCMYNYLNELRPDIKTVYMSAEHFVNEYISSLRNKKENEFINWLDSIDCLLFDNVDYLCGRASMLEKFQSIYRMFTALEKTVILGSDYSKEKILDRAKDFEKIFENCEILKISE